MTISEFREWLMLASELFICAILVLEYRYDKIKDDKKRRTKTTKKVTTQPSGISTTEETTEISEPTNEGNK